MTPRPLTAILGSSLVLAFAACKTEPPKVEPTPPTLPAATPSPPAAVPAPAPAAAPAEAAVAEFAANPHQHMKAHFVRALKLQDAVLAGKLAEARTHGRWLATHDSPDAPAGWRPYLATFQSEAKVVAEAESVDVAAAAAGNIAAACGDCHAANHARPKIGGTPILKNAVNVKEHMSAQLIALDKLWDGLVVPSDDAWRDGAAALAKVVVPQKALAKAGVDKADSVKLLVETLHQLSATAGKAEKADRPQVYANLLTTCVACHSAVRVLPGHATVAATAAQN